LTKSSKGTGQARVKESCPDGWKIRKNLEKGGKHFGREPSTKGERGFMFSYEGRKDQTKRSHLKESWPETVLSGQGRGGNEQKRCGKKLKNCNFDPGQRGRDAKPNKRWSLVGLWKN